jgi:hypothetical protein
MLGMDAVEHLEAAFARLAVRPSPGLAAFAAGVGRKGAVRGRFLEALHPRGRNVPDVLGRVNRGQFRNKFAGEEAGREGEEVGHEDPRAKGPAPPAQKARSPLPGVSPGAYQKARERAQRAVQKAAAKGERRLRQFADRAEGKARRLIAELKAQGHQPRKDTLGEPLGWLYAYSVAKARLAREAVAALPAGGAPRGETRQPVEPVGRGPVPPKSVRRLMRFTSAAVRRRVLHGLRNELQLAEALGGLNLPDSEAADVVLIVGPAGELVTDHKAVLSFLRVREDAVRRAAKMTPEEVQAAGLGAVLSAPLYLLECKTLITSARGQVRVSRHARGRKRAWARRYAAPFGTVIFDDRRGAKYSGNRLYYRPDVGTTSLSRAFPVGSFGDLAGEIGKGAGQ